MGAPQGKDGLLNSWKEIAVYLGRGVRTVQRRERMGLPVCRFKEGLSPVIADAHDIDVWLQSAQTHGIRRSTVERAVAVSGSSCRLSAAGEIAALGA
jgi:hypothetical protein